MHFRKARPRVLVHIFLFPYRAYSTPSARFFLFRAVPDAAAACLDTLRVFPPVSREIEPAHEQCARRDFSKGGRESLSKIAITWWDGLFHTPFLVGAVVLLLLVSRARRGLGSLSLSVNPVKRKVPEPGRAPRGNCDFLALPFFFFYDDGVVVRLGHDRAINRISVLISKLNCEMGTRAPAAVCPVALWREN